MFIPAAEIISYEYAISILFACTNLQPQRHPNPVSIGLDETNNGLTAALPPDAKIFNPQEAARGCVHATIPLVEWTTLLLLEKGMKSGWDAIVNALNFDSLLTNFFNLGSRPTKGVLIS